ncbi:MAG: protein phosphatase 2C domain-containing protein [Lachnospiraceae bacterium]|nr:protein phosphatase 2C domain-containing protein [Lachnospiraceae bacterium]
MLDYELFSNKGGRDVNEDCVLCAVKENSSCFVLCDGLGGHGRGDEASSLVCNSMIDVFNNCSDPDDFMGTAFMDAQKRLIAAQIEKKVKNQMKTTAVALLCDSKNARIAHVGDSRLYVFNKKGGYIRTEDHSVPQLLVKSGEIKESEIRNHPDRNRLMRAMGNEWDKPMYQEMKKLPLKKCNAFLLCSDGFWELIDESEMAETLNASSSAKEWVEKMAAIVAKNGEGRNMDNYSAIAVINRA